MAAPFTVLFTEGLGTTGRQKAPVKIHRKGSDREGGTKRIREGNACGEMPPDRLE